jgi:hypothetical protein
LYKVEAALSVMLAAFFGMLGPVIGIGDYGVHLVCIVNKTGGPPEHIFRHFNVIRKNRD